MGCGLRPELYRHAARCAGLMNTRPVCTLSVVIAIGVSLVGLWLVFHLRDPSARTWWWRVGGAVVMGVAIPSMHYVAMAAVEYTPTTELPDVSYAIQISSLGAILIGIATLSTVLMRCAPQCLIQLCASHARRKARRSRPCRDRS